MSTGTNFSQGPSGATGAEGGARRRPGCNTGATTCGRLCGQESSHLWQRLKAGVGGEKQTLLTAEKRTLSLIFGGAHQLNQFN